MTDQSHKPSTQDQNYYGMAAEQLREKESRNSGVTDQSQVRGAEIPDPFNEWWRKDGRMYDPDTYDVPWFDKRQALAEYAFAAGKNASNPMIDQLISNLRDERNEAESSLAHERQRVETLAKALEEISSRRLGLSATLSFEAVQSVARAALQSVRGWN